MKKSYLALQRANEHIVEDLAGLVAVANVLKGLGCVLAANIEENFLTAPVPESAMLLLVVLRAVEVFIGSELPERRDR